MPRCCSGSPGRQRFDHHGVVQGQVQQVEDQQHRRKRYRLQKVWTQGNVDYCFHRGVKSKCVTISSSDDEPQAWISFCKEAQLQ